MAVTVGEVNALLTVRDEMTAQLKAAQQNVKDLEAAFVTYGGSATRAGQAVEKELDAAKAKLDELNASMKTTTASAEDFESKVSTANGTMDQMDRIATRLIERMAIMFAVKGTEQFIAGLFTAAEKTSDLSAQLDISIGKVQEFEFAAKETGVPLGTLTNAMDTLGKKIAGDSQSVSNSLETLGLNTDAFFSADPSERFDQVSRAISDMGDKTARTGAEVALFGTDKIDPLITRLNALEKAAHDAGVVLSDEDTKALADAKKSMETFTTVIEVQASAWLVAAQNAVAYYAAARAGVPQLEDQPGVQALVTAPGSPKKSLPSASSSAGGMDPNNAKVMDALNASAKLLTDGARDRIAAENQEAKILHEIAQIENGRISDASALLKLTQNQRAELEASAKSMKELATAATAEMSAKSANLGRFGLAQDSQGTTMPADMVNDPMMQMQDKLRKLSMEPNTAAGKDERTQQIYNEFIDATTQATTVIVGMTAAERAAADSAGKLATTFSSAMTTISGAVNGRADDSRNSPLAYDAGLGMPTSNGVGSMAGGSGVGMFGQARISTAGMAAGIPSSGGQVSVNVQGNVYTMDPSGKAAFAQLVSDALQPGMRQGRQLPGG